MLILTSLLPINIPILRYERDRKMYIKELNEWLMEMAKMNNLIFVNYYATMTFPVQINYLMELHTMVYIQMLKDINYGNCIKKYFEKNGIRI